MVGSGSHDCVSKIVVRGGGLQQIPRDVGSIPRCREKAEGQRAPDRANHRSHVRRRTDVHLPLSLVIWWAEIDKTGKVVLDSKETLASVQFFTAFWKEAHDEGGLAWDDTNNNRAFLSGEISATLNGASIYVESLRKPDQYKTDKGARLNTDILHAGLPGGPAGRYAYHTAFSHMIMKYSKNQKPAKEFLRWAHAKDNYEKWFVVQKGFAAAPTKVWESHAMWTQNPVMLPFKTALQHGRAMGYAGEPNRKAAEVWNKYIITDMYAKAVQGMKAEETVRWAAGELRKIYV